MKILKYAPYQKATALEVDRIVSFLFHHLDQYGDKKEDIRKAIEYALKERPSHGGFLVVAEEDDQIMGTVVINKTGMEGYIPENILVYIAVHQDARGRGLGKQLMQEALSEAEGAVALHVEPDNPAVHLYKKMGFTNKYLEMRYSPE